MAYFEFPNTRNYDGDLGWVVKKLKETADLAAYLNEEFSKIVILTQQQIQSMIDAAIAANNIYVAQQLAALKVQITNEYKTYCDNQINSLKIYVDNQDLYFDTLAQGYADTALADAKTYTDDQVLNYTLMINPITGEYEDVRDVVTDIVTYFHSEDTLTASEYDNLEMTADDYDLKELTAIDYDFNGKNLLP